MTTVVINSNEYSDDGTGDRDLTNGGHRDWFVPLISDVVTVAAEVQANADAAETSAAEAQAAGFRYTFSSTTTMADPGAGAVRFNNATIASVTALAFDATSADTGNPDVSDFIATWGSSTNTTKGYITFRKIGTPATFVIFAVTAAVTDNTGWLQVTVSYVAGNGALSNADVLAVAFDKVADKGVDGVDGEVSLNGTQTLTNKTIAFANNTLTGVASTGGNTFTGAQVLSDQQVSRAMLIDQGYAFVDKGNSGTTTQTLDYTAGSHQKITATGNHTIAVSNFPPSGNLGVILIELVNGGAYTITWPTVNWVKPDGSTTTSFSTWIAAVNGRTALQSSGTDFIRLISRDGGTTLYGGFAL